MKRNRIYILMCLIFFFFMVGFSNDIENKENTIIVEKQIEKTNEFNHHREIKDAREIQEIRDILGSLNWQFTYEDFFSGPDYRFYLKDTYGTSDSKSEMYKLWISPTLKNVEIVVHGQAKYVQLDKGKSARLFELLTGNTLGMYPLH